MAEGVLERGEEEGKEGGRGRPGGKVIEMEIFTVLELSLHSGRSGGRDGVREGGFGHGSIAIPPEMQKASPSLVDERHDHEGREEGREERKDDVK